VYWDSCAEVGHASQFSRKAIILECSVRVDIAEGAYVGFAVGFSVGGDVGLAVGQDSMLAKHSKSSGQPSFNPVGQEWVQLVASDQSLPQKQWSQQEMSLKHFKSPGQPSSEPSGQGRAQPVASDQSLPQ